MQHTWPPIVYKQYLCPQISHLEIGNGSGYTYKTPGTNSTNDFLIVSKTLIEIFCPNPNCNKIITLLVNAKGRTDIGELPASNWLVKGKSWAKIGPRISSSYYFRQYITPCTQLPGLGWKAVTTHEVIQQSSVNSLDPERCCNDFISVLFKFIFMNWYLQYFMWDFSHVNPTEPHWL